MAKDGSSGESAPDVACITDYKTLHRCTTERLSLVRAIPRTGRRHQIRRHLRRINHPLAGDVNYGNGKDNRYYRSELGLYRLALHAQWLALPHPETGASIAFEASPPPDLLDVFDRLEIPPETYARPAQAIE